MYLQGGQASSATGSANTMAREEAGADRSLPHRRRRTHLPGGSLGCCSRNRTMRGLIWKSCKRGSRNVSAPGQSQSESWCAADLRGCTFFDPASASPPQPHHQVWCHGDPPAQLGSPVAEAMKRRQEMVHGQTGQFEAGVLVALLMSPGSTTFIRVTQVSLPIDDCSIVCRITLRQHQFGRLTPFTVFSPYQAPFCRNLRLRRSPLI